MLDDTRIITLEPDQIISEPGFYRIPIERHHNQPCNGVSVTSSVLRTMETHTPADVWAFHLLNRNRWVREETDALLMGRAMASFVEGGVGELQRRFFVLPDDKPSRPTAKQLAAIREGRGTDAGTHSVLFWQEVARDPRAELTEKQWQLILSMGNVARDDPGAQAALGGQPEITMAWWDDVNRLWCLSRPDQVSFSGMLSDYKKISTQGRPFNQAICDQRITAHRYDMQMAFAAEGFEALTGHWPDQVGLVFQTDAPPHHVILTSLTEEDLHIGEFHNRRARARFRECLDAGYWPGPGEHVMAYRRPDYLREKALEEMNMEGTAP